MASELVTPLIAISEKLATALRSMPCTCIEIGSWPLFKAEAAGTPEKPGRFTPKTCARCKALAEYDAYTGIVQIPGKPQESPK